MRNRNILWRIVLLSLLFYSVSAFLSVSDELRQKRQTADSLQTQLAELQMSNSRLRAVFEQGTDTQLEAMARERLGLVLPGEKLFYFIKDREDIE